MHVLVYVRIYVCMCMYVCVDCVYILYHYIQAWTANTADHDGIDGDDTIASDWFNQVCTRLYPQLPMYHDVL